MSPRMSRSSAKNPASTTLRWDGPADGVMLDYGPGIRSWRLTFDGRSKARTAIRAHGKSFANLQRVLRHLCIRDVGIGIEAGAPGGQGIAETTGATLPVSAVLDCRHQYPELQLARLVHLALSLRRLRPRRDESARCGHFHVFESLFRRSQKPTSASATPVTSLS